MEFQDSRLWDAEAARTGTCTVNTLPEARHRPWNEEQQTLPGSHLARVAYGQLASREPSLRTFQPLPKQVPGCDK